MISNRPMALLRRAVLGQGQAALAMLVECIRACPDELWVGIIGRYPFWHVAYHTLCFADVYCAKADEVWKPIARFHPMGRKELEGEYPSRRFERNELLAYAELCKKRLASALRGETVKSLAGPSGFPWLKMQRVEVYLYNLRHVQHHTGQLGAFLRRAGIATKWSKRGRG